MADENESEEQEQEQEFKVSDRRYSVRGYEDEDEDKVSGVEEKAETPPQASPVVSDPSQTAEAPGPGISGASAPAGPAGEGGPAGEAPPPEAPPGEGGPTEEAPPPEAPPEEDEVSKEFETLLAILQTNAIAAMGINPQTGERSGGADPRSAKLFVDMISMVKDKMAGNLSEGEEQILSQVLSDLRMMYVQHVGIE